MLESIPFLQQRGQHQISLADGLDSGVIHFAWYESVQVMQLSNWPDSKQTLQKSSFVSIWDKTCIQVKQMPQYFHTVVWTVIH